MKIKEKCVNAVNSPQASKERMFHAYMLVESLCIVFQKLIFGLGLRLSLVLNSFLIFHQISGSSSYKKA